MPSLFSSACQAEGILSLPASMTFLLLPASKTFSRCLHPRPSCCWLCVVHLQVHRQSASPAQPIDNVIDGACYIHNIIDGACCNKTKYCSSGRAAASLPPYRMCPTLFSYTPPFYMQTTTSPSFSLNFHILQKMPKKEQQRPSPSQTLPEAELLIGLRETKRKNDD